MEPPQGVQEVPPSVADRLRDSSILFARSAAAAYASESWDVFYLHLATAVEQLLKAILARAHPALIADPRGSFDSLLHLCGLGHRASAPDFVVAVRTIGASEALDRIGRLVEGYQEPNLGVRSLLATRNRVVHAGLRAKAGGEAILGDVATYVASLLPSLAIRPEDYWGEFAEMVGDHAERRLSATEATCLRKVNAARERYAQRTSSMEDEVRDAYLAAVVPPPPEPGYEWASIPCPACDNVGMLTGAPDPEWEADWDVEGGEPYLAGAYVGSIRIDPEGFKCDACGLHLDRSLLAAAGIGPATLTDQDFDVSEASSYFGRLAADESWDPD